MSIVYNMHKKKIQSEINDKMHGENMMLLFISENSHVIPSEISKEMGITSARVAAALNSMEKKGYIERNIDPEDRRRIIVSITKEGKNQVHESGKKVIAMTVDMLEYLGEHDALEFLRIMKKISKRHQDKCD